MNGGKAAERARVRADFLGAGGVSFHAHPHPHAGQKDGKTEPHISGVGRIEKHENLACGIGVMEPAERNDKSIIYCHQIDIVPL